MCYWLGYLGYWVKYLKYSCPLAGYCSFYLITLEWIPSSRDMSDPMWKGKKEMIKQDEKRPHGSWQVHQNQNFGMLPSSSLCLTRVHNYKSKVEFESLLQYFSNTQEGWASMNPAVLLFTWASSCRAVWIIDSDFLVLYAPRCSWPWFLYL